MTVREAAPLSDAERSRVYYDAIAPHYDHDLTTTRRDRLAREAFVDLVSRCVPLGGTVLDFGCGTGLDSDVFARLGYAVLAYDSSSGMVAELEQRCGDAIGAGRIRVADAGTPFETTLATWPQPTAVVANFAVLNMIDRPGALFERLAERTVPEGWLIVSVLNPFHWRELLTWRWWHAALRHRRGTPLPHLRQHFNSYLHFERDLCEAAGGYRLVGRANAGSIVRYDQPGDPSAWWGRDEAGVVTRLLWRTPLRRYLGTFVFLVLRRP